MKTFILRWNPNISSYTLKNQKKDIKAILKGKLSSMDWSVREWEKIEVNDFWILQTVGTDYDGIAAFGTFTGRTTEAESWRHDGTKVHYAQMIVWAIIDRNISKKFAASEMENLCPKIDWHGGHSGIVVSAEEGEKIFLHLFTHFMGNTGPNPVEAFDRRYDTEIQDYFINNIEEMAPDFCRRFYESHDCICDGCNKVISPKPEFDQIYFYYKTDTEALSNYPKNPTLADLENYLAFYTECSECGEEEECYYSEIKKSDTIKKYFGFFTGFHDCYIREFSLENGSGKICIQADQCLNEGVKPCLVCIKVKEVLNIAEFSLMDLSCQPIFELRAETIEGGVRLIFDGIYFTIDCKEAEFSIVTKRTAKSWNCWRE